MKKLSLISAIFGLAFVGAASAANITVYYSPTCPHCHHAREFFSTTLVYEYPELTVTEVNVTEDAKTQLFRDALAKCEYTSGGVPVIVVGEKCFQGYAEFMQQDIRDAVEADMTDEAKAVAAENKKALEADPAAFKAENAKRASAVSEYKPAVASNDVKKNDGDESYVFYAILIALVAALGVVLIRKKK